MPISTVDILFCILEWCITVLTLSLFRPYAEMVTGSRDEDALFEISGEGQYFFNE